MPENPPAIAVLPSYVKTGRHPEHIPLDRLVWPLGRPGRLMSGTLADMAPDDHLIVFPRTIVHFRPGLGTPAKVSLMVVEPRAIQRQHFALLRLSWRRFHRVLSCNEDLLARISNGIFFPIGSTWVPEWRGLDVTKSRMCSLIASSKRSQKGHRLRHRIARMARAEGWDVEVMGGGYKPFEKKSDGLAPYRYSVVIENVRERNYFTEKIVDAVLCRTVPIYWGCPNIGDFMDTGGMMLCESAEDIRVAMRMMSAADYAARLPALEKAQQGAEAHADYLGRAALAVLEDRPVPARARR